MLQNGGNHPSALNGNTSTTMPTTASGGGGGLLGGVKAGISNTVSKLSPNEAKIQECIDKAKAEHTNIRGDSRAMKTLSINKPQSFRRRILNWQAKNTMTQWCETNDHQTTKKFNDKEEQEAIK